MTIQPISSNSLLTVTPLTQVPSSLRVQAPTFDVAATYLSAVQEEGPALLQAQATNLLADTNILQTQANNLLANTDLLEAEASTRLAEAAPPSDTTRVLTESLARQANTPLPPPATVAQQEAADAPSAAAVQVAAAEIEAGAQEQLAELQVPAEQTVDAVTASLAEAAAALLPAAATPGTPAAPLPGAVDLQGDLALQAAGSTALQADIAAAQIADTSDLQADDIVAQAAMVLQAQQTVIAALNSGAKDVSLLLSGLPAGATATLLGGGWVRVPPDSTAAETDALWAFHFNLTGLDVPAVTSTTRTDPSQDKEKPATGGETPLTSYGARGQKAPAPGQLLNSTLDILD